MREDIIKKISEIVAGEKLALDSYFFCGSGSSLPDEELIQSGEAFLAAVKEGRTDEAAKAKLIARLEAAAAQKPQVLKSRVQAAESEDARSIVIKEILDYMNIL